MSAKDQMDGWPKALTDAFWAAANAPTYSESRDNTLALLDAYAAELAEKVQAARDDVRATNWGRASRSKRAYLQGMERAQRLIEPGKEATCSDPGT